MAILLRRETVPMADPGTVIVIVSWILLAVVLCALVARFVMKLTMKTSRRRFGLDDLFIAFAALFSFGQTIAVSIAAKHALGQHLKGLKPYEIDIFHKTQYAGCLLYIANMGCARISVCLVIRKVLPGIVAKYTAVIFASFTAFWTVSGMIVNAFPCKMPTVWKFTEPQNCIDIVAFVNYIGITNIVVEVILVLIPLFIWNVRLSAGSRISVSLCFLSRLSIVAAVGAQLYYFNKPDLKDPTYDSWISILCLQIAQNLSVITACLPCLHPFIISIIAGTTEPEMVKFHYGAPPCLRNYLDRKNSGYDPTMSRSSHASITPFAEKTDEPYCRPLATHGLDRASITHHHSTSLTRFPANVAKPVFTSTPPENFFNRQIEVPPSRPGTSSSSIHQHQSPAGLGDVGILPIIDWDSESNTSSGSSRRSSPSRQPTAEYIFNRSKVISIPEERNMYDAGIKHYVPPLPSPRMVKKPPRAF